MTATRAGDDNYEDSARAPVSRSRCTRHAGTVSVAAAREQRELTHRGTRTASRAAMARARSASRIGGSRPRNRVPTLPGCLKAVGDEREQATCALTATSSVGSIDNYDKILGGPARSFPVH
jgi:hypothetical protein